jgi:hypothetical protein
MTFLLLAVPSASGLGDQEFAASFCSECWRFLESQDVCHDSTCLTCAKEAVAVDARLLSWTWCPIHDQWHRRPCPEGKHDRAERGRTALALVVSPGDERLEGAAYCPECRTSPDPMTMERGRCPTCQGPLVAVETVEPVWFWCTHDLHWKEEPCPGNGVRHCCTAYRGSVLAIPRSFKTALTDGAHAARPGGSGRVP